MKETKMEKKKYKLKSITPKVFKFEKGESWDGDEMILHYIEGILLDDDSKIKQKTYITVHCVRAVNKIIKKKKGGGK